MNRVNQITPQGNLTYSQAGPKWDEAAYLKANPEVAANLQSGLWQGTGQDYWETKGRAAGHNAGVAEGYQPDAPWTATQSYSPEQQKLYDLSTQAQTAYGEAGLAQLGKLREQMSTPFSFQGAPDYQSVASRSGQVQSGYDTGGAIQRQVGPNDFSADRTRVEEALYGRLNPSLEQQRTGLETRLRSQGLAPGSEAWSNAMRAQSQSENDARLGVTAQGLQEQQGMFGMDLQRGTFANQAQAQQYGQNASLAQFGNSAALQQQNMDTSAGTYGQQQRQQMLAEQLAIRSQPLNETSALLTGSQVQTPAFANVPGAQVANTDVISPYNTQYQGQLGAYQGQVATNNANTGAAAGTAAAAASVAAAAI